MRNRHDLALCGDVKYATVCTFTSEEGKPVGYLWLAEYNVCIRQILKVVNVMMDRSVKQEADRSVDIIVREMILPNGSPRVKESIISIVYLRYTLADLELRYKEVDWGTLIEAKRIGKFR